MRGVRIVGQGHIGGEGHSENLCHNFHPTYKYWGVGNDNRALLGVNRPCSSFLQKKCILRVIEIWKSIKVSINSILPNQLQLYNLISVELRGA